MLLGIVEGITEFLPVSSTGHLTIVEKFLGLTVDDPGVTAFTAIIQVGAILAAIIYFRSDIARLGWGLAAGWLRHVATPRLDHDYRFAWYVILGSIPIGIVGFLAQDLIAGGLRSLWVVVAGLIGWSAVMWAARTHRQKRPTRGIRQPQGFPVHRHHAVLRPDPGRFRSGATISAGLFRNLDRVAATRLSFFLAIPALVAAGAYEAVKEASVISSGIGWLPTIVATAVSFVVGYVSIAWLLRFVSKHSITVFIWYRVALGIVIAVLLGSGMSEILPPDRRRQYQTWRGRCGCLAVAPRFEPTTVRSHVAGCPVGRVRPLQEVLGTDLTLGEACGEDALRFGFRRGTSSEPAERVDQRAS